LKNTIFIFILFFSAVFYAQNSLDEFSKLMNFNLEGLTKKTENSPLPGKINSISSVLGLYEFHNILKLSVNEVTWLEGRINEISAVFYLQGKP
jgi:hypothetical protein